ncbi:transposase family protein [Streptomyces sp. NPDC050743]|uniref:transposase family protein n=1 Tax=Streptomyces sp. NPDC050743 TaxID=3365634 RepID=UPI003788BCF3
MPSVLDQLAQAVAPAPLTDALCLSEFLDLVPDPRGFRGRRYLLSALVAAAAASVLAGARSLTAITEWMTLVAKSADGPMGKGGRSAERRCLPSALGVSRVASGGCCADSGGHGCSGVAGASAWDGRDAGPRRAGPAVHRRRLHRQPTGRDVPRSGAAGAVGPCPCGVDTCSCCYAASVRVADCCS